MIPDSLEYSGLEWCIATYQKSKLTMNSTGQVPSSSAPTETGSTSSSTSTHPLVAQPASPYPPHFSVNHLFFLPNIGTIYPPISQAGAPQATSPDPMSSTPIFTAAKKVIFGPEVVENLKNFLKKNVGETKPTTHDFLDELLKAFFAQQIKGFPVHEPEQLESLKRILELSILPDEEPMTLLDRVWSLMEPREGEVVDVVKTSPIADEPHTPTTGKPPGKLAKTASTRLSKQPSLSDAPHCSTHTKVELQKLMNKRRLSKMGSSESTEDAPGPAKQTCER